MRGDRLARPEGTLLCLAGIPEPTAVRAHARPQDIFAFFIDRLISQKGGLAKPGSADYADCFYLLENLSNVKSITLVTDLPGADEMITDVFRGFFDLIR
jgi:sister-chromatid-cohesion protein PDS5